MSIYYKYNYYSEYNALEKNMYNTYDISKDNV